MSIKSYSLNIKSFFGKSQKENKKVNSNIAISKKPSLPKTILVLFPIEHDFFRVASYSYRNLPYDRSDINFHYIINRNFSDSFSLRRGVIHKIDLDAKSNIRNKSTLLEYLSKTKFDVIIDLNINYQQTMSDFILMQKSNYKIGFKHKKSDFLYNVQLDISKSQIAENGYQKILELI